ncbi:MAG TPA: DUF5680 domain-containing protein [archaeon]|nr:DUF5680 domain-containing protein [archaeon]
MSATSRRAGEESAEAPQVIFIKLSFTPICMEINLEELARFLVKAKSRTYAGDGKEIPPQRPGFKELEYVEGNLEYRDSYAGFYFAPGQEIVRLQGRPVWAMAYSGGMRPEYHGQRDFAKQTFTFLKQALSIVEESRPFRGPENFRDGEWEYTDTSEGDITDFKGTEHILFQGKEVFRQHYIGGLILPK